MRISVVASLLSSLALAACGTSSQPQSYIPPLTAYPTGPVAAQTLPPPVTAPAAQPTVAATTTQPTAPVAMPDASTATEVRKTDHHKCGRCWRHVPEVETDGALCGRCEDMLA